MPMGNWAHLSDAQQVRLERFKDKGLTHAVVRGQDLRMCT